MGVLELFLIGVGLSMDAFAVAVCKGLGMRQINYRHMFCIALFFGGFQALMPYLGWVLGDRCAAFVAPIDHWIAFALLVFVGGKMLVGALLGNKSELNSNTESLDIKELFMLAVATSIDALAVGVSFAFLQVDIFTACIIIGCTTFILSLFGVVIGNRFGMHYEKSSSILGGTVLILLGFKILFEHLGILG